MILMKDCSINIVLILCKEYKPFILRAILIFGLKIYSPKIDRKNKLQDTNIQEKEICI